MDKDLLSGKLGANGSFDIALKAGNVVASLSFDNSVLGAQISLLVKDQAGLELLKPHLPAWAQGLIPLIESVLTPPVVK